MPYNTVTGAYTPAAGAESAAPGQVLQSAVWDNIFTDLSTALTTVQQQLQATYGSRNIIGANGGLEVWQRGAGGSASFAISASSIAYTADRWYIATSANEASTVTQVAGIVTGSRWAAKVQRNSGQTGTSFIYFGFPLDSDECAMIAGQTVALSFTAKAGANFSAASSVLAGAFEAGTGAPTKFANGYAGGTTPIPANATISTSPTRFTFTGSIPSTTTQAEVLFGWIPVGTAGTDDSFTIDDVQLEILPSASSPIAAFERWSFERMLLACKRHYRKSFPYATAPAQSAGLPGVAQLVTAAAAASGFWIQHYPVSLRATAAYTTYNPNGASANAQDLTGAVSLAVSLDPSGGNGPDSNLIYVSAAAAANRIVAVHWQADSGI
jgi:hypothetical protein